MTTRRDSGHSVGILVASATLFTALSLELCAAEPKNRSPFSAKPTDESAIEVVGITSVDVPRGTPRVWWLPDGTVLPRDKSPRVALTPDQTVAVYGANDSSECLLVVREVNIHGKPIVDPVGGYAENGRFNEMATSFDFGNEQIQSGHRVIRVKVYEKDRFSIRLRIATTGNWETVARATIESIRAPNTVLDCSRIVCISPVTERLAWKTKDDGSPPSSVAVPLEKTQTAVSYAVPLVNPRTCFRIVAVDRAGKTHFPQRDGEFVHTYWWDREACGEQGSLAFPDLSYEEVAAVAIQARPIHIVELSDFAGKPGIDATATIKNCDWTLDDARTELQRLDRRETGTVDLYVCRRGAPTRVVASLSDELAVSDILKLSGVDLANAKRQGEEVTLQIWDGFSARARIPPVPRNPFLSLKLEVSLTTSHLARVARWESQRVTHLMRSRVPFKPKLAIFVGQSAEFEDFETAVDDAIGNRVNDPMWLAQLTEDGRRTIIEYGELVHPLLKNPLEDVDQIKGLLARTSRNANQKAENPGAMGGEMDEQVHEQIPAKLKLLKGAAVRFDAERSIAIHGSRALVVTHFQAVRGGTDWVSDAGYAALYHFETNGRSWRLTDATKEDVDGVFLALCRLYCGISTVLADAEN